MRHNLSYSAILRECSKYDLVSFDCFDTLIFRCLTSPEDLFSFLGFEYGIPNFTQLRIKAEKQARDENLEKIGVRECRIEEIYQKLSQMTFIEQARGVSLEIEYEKKACYPNEFMRNVYNALIGQGKKIIVTSNMYLSEHIIEEILNINGYAKPEKIYVSCDYKKNKRGGLLFEEIKSKFPGKRIVHIGDDLSADIKGAEAAGIDAILYRKCTEDKKNIIIGKSSHLTASIYNAIVSNYLNNKFNIEEKNGTTRYFQHGFKYGGLFILGYVRKIIEWSQQDGIEKILFLARDGDFLKEIFDILQTKNKIPWEYVLWSRRAAMQTMPEVYMDDYFNNIVSRRINSGIYLSFKDFCEKLDIPIEEDARFERNKIIKKENLQEFKEYFYKYQAHLRKKSMNGKRIALEYIKRNIGNAKKVAIVDIGWRASGALSIERLLKNDPTFSAEIYAYVAGNYKRKNGYDTIQKYKRKIRSYMFSEYENFDVAEDFQKNITKMVPIIEILGASSTSPSFVGFSEEGNFLFDVPEAENYKIIKEIHKGEMAFISEYIKRTKWILDDNEIPGRDCYYILKNALNNKSLIKDFSIYSYPQFVSDNTSQIKIDNLGDFWGV